MHFDLMTGGLSWQASAQLAAEIEASGFSGMLFTETSQVPWMMIAAAATAAPTLAFSTGIAVAFPRSPMVSAQVAWELAANTQGRFRLGLGSQVRAHITRRYAAEFDRPAARMRDYVGAVKACLAAFRGEARLDHSGPFYTLNLLRREWSPPTHAYETKVDIAAVGPLMCRVAGEVADGVHVHPMHSMTYIEKRLRPALAEGAAIAGRDPETIDLIVPVFAIPGDSPEERAPLVDRARTQIAFYGSTPNYAFQFDDLGFPGTTERIRTLLRARRSRRRCGADRRRHPRAFRRGGRLGRSCRRADRPLPRHGFAGSLVSDPRVDRPRSGQSRPLGRDRPGCRPRLKSRQP